MTDQDQNIIAAKACGWRQIEKGKMYEGQWYKEHWTDCRTEPLDYGKDLNAIQDAILNVINTDALRRDFHNELHFICLRDNEHDLKCHQGRRLFYRENATAIQRREAFIRTIGKWKD